jgi:hypothetical protein
MSSTPNELLSTSENMEDALKFDKSSSFFTIFLRGFVFDQLEPEIEPSSAIKSYFFIATVLKPELILLGYLTN